MAGYWPSSFLRVSSRSIKTNEKERGQYLAFLTEQAWSIKDLLYGKKHQSMICILVGQSPYPKRALSCPLG